MEFSTELNQITQAYNLTPNDVIFCYAIAAGAPSTDAYTILLSSRKSSTTQDQAQRNVNDYLRRNPAAKILINRIKAGRRNITKDTQQLRKKDINQEEMDELKTRDGIIRKLIENVTDCAGKDAVSGLQTLAKLQGLDKPDEVPEEDRRLFVLTWLSHCRTCKLMGAYLDAQKAAESPETAI